MIRNRHRNIIAPLALLTVLPVAWWWPLLAGWLPDFMDTVTYLYPMRMAIARQIQQGTLPLWMPNLFAGVPLAANPQLATWYPPQILFYIAPGPLAYGALVVLHYIGAGMGMFFLGRFYTRNSLAALFAAVTFQFSAMLVSRVALAPHVYSAAWLPWIFLAAERLLRVPSPRRAGLLAMCVSLQFLAGSPQFSYYTVLVLGLLVVMRWGQGARAWRWLAVAAVAAILLTGIQLIPTLDYIRMTGRGEIPVAKLHEQALNGGYVWRAITGVTGDPIEDTDSVNAVGPGALLLAVAALISRRRRLAAPLVVIAVLSWVVSLGALTPVLHGVLPGYDRFHAPRRAMMLWSFAMPAASAIGAAWMLRRLRPRWLGPVVLVVALGGTAWMLPRLERVFADPIRFDGDQSILSHIGQDRFLVIDPAFNYAYDSRRPDYGYSMMTNLAALHNTMDVQGYDPLVPERYATARDLASRASGVFYPSHGAYFTDPGHPLLRLLNVQWLMGRVDLFEPGRVIAGRRIDTEGILAATDLVTSHTRWPLYRYRERRPFAWTVEQVFPVPDWRQALTAGAIADPTRYAFIEPPNFSAQLSTASVTARYNNGRKISLQLDAAARGPILAVVSVAYAPGWEARTDKGRVSEVIPINGLITGVLLPPGTTSVTLTYEPKSFQYGVLLTLGGLLITSVLFWGQKRRSP